MKAVGWVRSPRCSQDVGSMGCTTSEVHRSCRGYPKCHLNCSSILKHANNLIVYLTAWVPIKRKTHIQSGTSTDVLLHLKLPSAGEPCHTCGKAESTSASPRDSGGYCRLY